MRSLTGKYAPFLVLLFVLFIGCTPTPVPDAAPPTLVSTDAPPGPPLRIPYGPSPDNIGDLYLPANGQNSLAVLVMIHGGGWQQKNTFEYMGPLSAAIAQQGVAVWSIEYRRGENQWANTLADVAAATDAVRTVVQMASGNRLDVNRIHVSGHSAGGQLAAWVASRGALPVDSIGSNPLAQIKSATIMAGVLDMRLAATKGSDKLVPAWLGGMPDAVPGRYAIASPIEHLPIGLPLTALHGDADTVVSIDQARTYVPAATAAGDSAVLKELPGVGHGGFVDPTSPAWAAAIDTITAHALRDR